MTETYTDLLLELCNNVVDAEVTFAREEDMNHILMSLNDHGATVFVKLFSDGSGHFLLDGSGPKDTKEKFLFSFQIQGGLKNNS